MKQRLLSVRDAMLITTLVSIVPALVIIIATGLEHIHLLEMNSRAEAVRHVEAISTLQAQAVENAMTTLETVAALPAFRDGDVFHQAEVLESVLSTNDVLHNISATDLNGVVQASPGLPRGTDLSDRRHVDECIRTERFVAGEFVFARSDGDPTFPYAVPIRDRTGTMTGVLTAVYPVVSYGALFDRLDLPEETILGITDHRGIRLFFRPEKSTNPIGEPIKGSTWETMSAGDVTGTIRTAGSDGVARFYAYQRLFLPNDGVPYLYVVVGFPETVARASALRILRRNLIAMVAVTTVAAVLTIVVGNVVFGRRVTALALTAEAISHGDLTARTGISPGRSEIARVAESIDLMAQRLQARQTERRREAQRIAESLKEKEILLKEIHHRVKNNMQLILSVVHLQREGKTDLDTFCTNLENRISAMAVVHEMLYQSRTVALVPVQEFLERLIASNAESGAVASVAIDAGDTELHLEYAMPLSLIVNELYTNACKHAVGDEALTVTISVAKSEGAIHLEVTDTGPGFPEPFDLRRSDGLGMHIVLALVEQLHGTVTVGGRSTTDERTERAPRGSRIVVTIPRSGKIEAPAHDWRNHAGESDQVKPEPPQPHR